MRSKLNPFCEDIVFYRFNMAYRDKDSILYQIYQKQISNFYYEDEILVIQEIHIKRNTTLYNKELIKLVFMYNVMEILNHHSRNQDIFAFYIFSKKCPPPPKWHCH